MTGRLVVVATPIGNLGDITARAVGALRDADHIACEDTRRTRQLLSALGIPGGGRLVAVHRHNEAAGAEKVVAWCEAGELVALVSDAGTPGVSDPGATVVAAAVAAGVVVEAAPGPSAALAALVVSGLPTARFCVEGFLPRKGKERKAALAALAAEPRTAVVYESPHRVRQTVAELRDALGAGRRAAVCRELTKLHEETWRGTLADAADHLSSVEPRGEYVVVVEGAVDVPGEPAVDVVAVVARHLAAGLSTRDAAAAAARELGIPKADAYAAALEIKRS